MIILKTFFSFLLIVIFSLLFPYLTLKLLRCWIKLISLIVPKEKRNDLIDELIGHIEAKFNQSIKDGYGRNEASLITFLHCWDLSFKSIKLSFCFRQTLNKEAIRNIDIWGVLEDETIYRELIGHGIYFAKVKGITNIDDARDISSEALLRTIERLKTPQFLDKLKLYNREQIILLIKKSMRANFKNYIKIAIQIKKINAIQTVEFAKQNYSERDNSYIRKRYKNETLSKKNLILVDLNKFDLYRMKNEINFFIEEKYGRDEWERKKFAINIYIKRFQENLTMDELKNLYPQVYVEEAYAEGQRIIKNYFILILKERKKSPLFEIEESYESR